MHTAFATGGMHPPGRAPRPHVTASFAYVRWHGRPGYQTRRQLDPAAALRPWVAVLQQLARQTPRVYGYVRNQFSGYAPRDGETLLRLLGQAHGEY